MRSSMRSRWHATRRSRSDGLAPLDVLREGIRVLSQALMESEAGGPDRRRDATKAIVCGADAKRRASPNSAAIVSAVRSSMPSNAFDDYY